MDQYEQMNADVREVQTLFFLKKYRQCAQICETLLAAINTNDECHILYLSFYLAVSHEELARQVYDMSKYKIARLDIAEKCYEDALLAATALSFRHDDTPRLPPEASSIAMLTPTKLPRDVSSMYLAHPPKIPRNISSISLLSGLSAGLDVSPHVRSSRLTEHIKSMREQILTHIALAREAKQRVVAAQAKRKSTTTPSTGSSLHTTTSLQFSKSYWLFTPDTVKSDEKQRRIEQGRERAWWRERFDPSRYRALAEQALSEL